MSLDVYHSGRYVHVEVAFGDRCGTQLFARLTWTCPWCHETKVWETTDEAMLTQLTHWAEADEHDEDIQDAMPAVPAGIREVLISGICPECWNKAFEDVDRWSSPDDDEDLPF